VLLRSWLSERRTSTAPSKKEIAALLGSLRAGDSDVANLGDDTDVDDHEDDDTTSEGCRHADEELTHTVVNNLRASDACTDADPGVDGSAAEEAQAAPTCVRPRQDAARKQTDLAAALSSKAIAGPGQYTVGDMLGADTRATLHVLCQADMGRHALIGVLRRLSHALVRSCAHAPISMSAVQNATR
jgi:hypothetical protein